MIAGLTSNAEILLYSDRPSRATKWQIHGKTNPEIAFKSFRFFEDLNGQSRLLAVAATGDILEVDLNTFDKETLSLTTVMASTHKVGFVFLSQIKT